MNYCFQDALSNDEGESNYYILFMDAFFVCRHCSGVLCLVINLLCLNFKNILLVIHMLMNDLFSGVTLYKTQLWVDGLN